MKRADVDAFLHANTRIVVATLEKDGRSHVTPVVATFLDEHFRFTTPRATRKVRNIERDPRVTLMVLGDNFWTWLSVEGQAQLIGLPEARHEMREVYERIAGKPHPDWDEYDAAMAAQQRVVVRISVDRMYPLED